MSQEQPLPEIKNIDEAIECMRGILSGDNQKIKLGTKIMKQFTKKTDSIAIFTYILANCNDTSLRHLSGILLKRNMITNFENLQPEAQKDLQRILLERFFLETQQSVRKYIGILIGVIAKLTLSEGKWDQLYNVIQQQIDVNNANLQMRIYGIQLLELVLEYSSHSLKNFYKNFLPFFSQSLTDSNKQIKIGAVKCLVNIFEDIHEMKGDDLSAYKQLITPILQVLDNLITEKDEELVYYCFDALNLLTENKQSILDSHLISIVEYLCSNKVLGNPHLSKRIKETVLDLIYSATEFHKGLWNKNIPALKALIKSICQIVTLPITDQDLLSEGEEPLQDIALWLLQTFTLNLNRKKTYGILLEEVTTFIHSNEPNKMNSGFLILAQLAEGCYEQIARNLQNPIMNDFVPKGLAHPQAEVRGAAIKALTYFADYLPVDICKYHSVIVPALLNCFSDLTGDAKVREKAVIALDIFCDNLETEDLLLYINTVVEKTCFLVSQDPNSSILMKRVAVSALASCISTVEHKFAPYVHAVGKLMHLIIQNCNKPEEVTLKSEAISCLGKIAGAFVKEDRTIYEMYVQPCVEVVYNNLTQADDYELREGCFAFFYNLANAIGIEFEPIFDKIIEFTLKQASSEEGLQGKKGEFSLDSDSESQEGGLLGEEEENHTGAYNVKSSFIMEKSAAITAVGQFAVACPMKFAPYYERALEICEHHFNYFNENVRQQVAKCYKDLCIGMVKTANGGSLPALQKGLPVQKRLPEKIENVIQIEVFQKFLYYLNEEEDPEVSAMAIEMLIDMIKNLGPCSFDKNIDDITESIVKLLENKNEDEEEQDQDDSQKELEGYVIEAVCDLIPILCKVLGDSFALHFQKIYPKMLSYLREDREINENIYMVGCFAQVFKYTPNFLQFTKDSLVPALFEKITLQDDDMNRNLAFCLGNMVEKGVQFVKDVMPQICGILKNIFANSVEQAAKDNAAAALCRVMMTVPDQFPLDQALEQILSIVPLKGDEEEEKTIIQTLLFLCNKYPNVVVNKVDKILEIFVDALGGLKRYKIKEELQGQIIQFLKNAVNSNENYKNYVQKLVLENSEKDKIVKMLQ